MADGFLLALLQMNSVVGDIAGNMARLEEAWRSAAEKGADLVVTPELFITGYPPQDFVLKARHRKVVRESVEALARATASGPAILLGAPWEEDGRIHNAALLLDGGQIVRKIYKRDLPNYGPFDEKRIFESGDWPEVLVWRGHRLGVMLCEDMWKDDVPRSLSGQSAEAFIVLNGSPYERGKQNVRQALARNRAQEAGIALAYVNQVGGQDELLFEGASFVLDGHGDLLAQAPLWEETVLYVTARRQEGRLVFEKGAVVPEGEDWATLYAGLCVGVRDFVRKNGFSRVLLGLSGGIDSALVAALAVDALGADKVRLVMMPSPYTSEESREEATSVAKALGARLDVLPIMGLMKAFEITLAESFMGCDPDVTEENIQARCRGVLLMALANKSGAMLLATGNKSEMAVGYATLYGDMCGGYAPLKDVYKTDVYSLARWRQKGGGVGLLGPKGALFPERIFEKPPTAELRAGQKDEDSLPPYATLDAILRCLVEKDMGVSETVMTGQDQETVRRVSSLLDGAEHKRRQAPPGPKTTSRHLGLDRRYPITNRYASRWKTQNTD